MSKRAPPSPPTHCPCPTKLTQVKKRLRQRNEKRRKGSWTTRRAKWMQVWYAFNLGHPFKFCGQVNVYELLKTYGSQWASKHPKAGSQWGGHIVKVVIFFSIIARRNCWMQLNVERWMQRGRGSSPLLTELHNAEFLGSRDSSRDRRNCQEATRHTCLSRLGGAQYERIT